MSAAGSAPGTLPRDYFDRLYAGDPDPWRFRTSDYERAKYDDTVACLNGRRFRRAVEIGCAIGELTARLAPNCDALLGVDIAEAPLEAARRRNADAPQVTFQRMTLPDETPPGRFDLIGLSEVLYYFSREDLARLADWTVSALEPGGVALAVCWLGETPDYPLTGDEAAEAFIAAVGDRLQARPNVRREKYRIDVLDRGA